MIHDQLVAPLLESTQIYTVRIKWLRQQSVNLIDIIVKVEVLIVGSADIRSFYQQNTQKAYF